jgi:glucose/arabinose dehydrogenase
MKPTGEPALPHHTIRTVALTAFAALAASVGIACSVASQTQAGGGRPSPIATSSPNATSSPLATPSSTPSPSRSPVLALQPVSGSYAQPLYLTAPPGDLHRLFIVQKGGVIRVVRDGRPLPQPFLDLTVKISAVSERGLLSLAFDPLYARNGYFYVYYTDTQGSIRIVRYRVSANPDRADAASARVLFTYPHRYANHNGGQLQFGPDGLLYAGLGDGGQEGDPHLYGQDLHTFFGKLITLDVRLTHPQARIYAYGLRNPWRFSFDPANGNLWIGDVGQNAWEEIDFLRAGTPAGTNFGWSSYEGDHAYKRQPIDRRRLVFPVFEYSHRLGDAVTGGYVYRGAAIPGLRGTYLFADFGSGRVWAMAGPHRAPVQISLGRKLTQVASFGRDAAGELYIVSLAGGVYRIVLR